MVISGFQKSWAQYAEEERVSLTSLLEIRCLSSPAGCAVPQQGGATCSLSHEITGHEIVYLFPK